MSSEKGLVVIIMAGGLGKRMQSEVPKVLHKVANIPMIVRLLTSLRELNQKIHIEKTMIVVGKYKRVIASAIGEYLDTNSILFVDQPEALGTGHAIQCCQKWLFPYYDHNVLILSGDVPLLSAETMYEMVRGVRSIRIMTTWLDDPSGYGRILRGEWGKFRAIVEEKDCDEEEKKISLVNAGIYTVDGQLLCRYLPHLKNNNSQGEYYLTDIVGLIRDREGLDVEMYSIPADKRREVMGVNTLEQLLALENCVS